MTSRCDQTTASRVLQRHTQLHPNKDYNTAVSFSPPRTSNSSSTASRVCSKVASYPDYNAKTLNRWATAQVHSSTLLHHSSPHSRRHIVVNAFRRRATATSRNAAASHAQTVRRRELKIGIQTQFNLLFTLTTVKTYSFAIFRSAAQPAHFTASLIMYQQNVHIRIDFINFRHRISLK